MMPVSREGIVLIKVNLAERRKEKENRLRYCDNPYQHEFVLCIEKGIVSEIFRHQLSQTAFALIQPCFFSLFAQKPVIFMLRSLQLLPTCSSFVSVSEAFVFLNKSCRETKALRIQNINKFPANPVCYVTKNAQGGLLLVCDGGVRHSEFLKNPKIY